MQDVRKSSGAQKRYAKEKAGHNWKDSEKIKQLLFFLSGNFCYAFAIQLFLAGNRIAAGGFAGIATVLSSFFPISISMIIFLMNVPLLVISLKVKGWKFTRNTLICTAFYSLVLECVSGLPVLTKNPLAASVYGGVLYGCGMACLVRSNSSTGGTDLLNRLLLTRFRNMSVGKMSMVLGGTVVLLSMAAFREIEVGLYAILTLYICSIFADKVLTGFDRAELCMIITNKDPVIISNVLMEHMRRAVTKIEGMGMYAQTGRSVLLMAVRPGEVPKIKDLIRTEDSESVVMVVQVKEVLGGGFKSLTAS